MLDAMLVALEPGVEKLCKHKVCCILLACAKPLQYGFGISQHWEALSYFFSCAFWFILSFWVEKIDKLPEQICLCCVQRYRCSSHVLNYQRRLGHCVNSCWLTMKLVDGWCVLCWRQCRRYNDNGFQVVLGLSDTFNFHAIKVELGWWNKLDLLIGSRKVSLGKSAWSGIPPCVSLTPVCASPCTCLCVYVKGLCGVFYCS